MAPAASVAGQTAPVKPQERRGQGQGQGQGQEGTAKESVWGKGRAGNDWQIEKASCLGEGSNLRFEVAPHGMPMPLSIPSIQKQKPGAHYFSAHNITDCLQEGADD